MSFPVFKTLSRNFRRVFFDWPIIWRYLQVPALLSGLLACAGIALIVLVDNDTFVTIDLNNKDEPVKIGGWFYAYQLGFSYLTWIPLASFMVSWIRYAAAGEAALVGRPLWALGRDEWRFIWSTIRLGLYALLVILISALAVEIIYAAGATLHRILEFGVIITVGLGVIAFIAFVVFYGWFFGTALRWSAALIPAAFVGGLDISRAWRVTRGVAWKMAGIYILLLLPFLILLQILLFTVSPEFTIDTAEALQRFSLFQMLQPILFMPLGVFFAIVWWGVYADVWRRPEAIDEWPITQFPLTPHP